MDILQAIDFRSLLALIGGLAFAEGASWEFTPRFRNYLYGRIKREYPREAREDEKQDPGDWRRDWLPQLLGRMEVAGYTILFAFAVPGAAGFAAGWIALKMATGWNRITRPERYYRRMAMAAMLVNLLNVGFALLGAGLYRWICSP